jgi:hypothetical protein
LRHAYGVGDPLRDSGETKNNWKKNLINWVHNFLFSKYSKVFYKFLKK